MESVKNDLVLARNENQNLKREVKDVHDTQQKLVPLTLGTKEGRQRLAAPPPSVFASVFATRRTMPSIASQDVCVCFATLVHPDWKLQGENYLSRLAKAPQD